MIKTGDLAEIWMIQWHHTYYHNGIKHETWQHKLYPTKRGMTNQMATMRNYHDQSLPPVAGNQIQAFELRNGYWVLFDEFDETK